MLTVRAGRPSGLACISSGIWRAAELNGKLPEVERVEAAAEMLPGAEEEGEHGDGAGCGAAVLGALDPVVEADDRRLAGGAARQVPRERARRVMVSAVRPVVAAAASGAMLREEGVGAEGFEFVRVGDRRRGRLRRRGRRGRGRA